MFMVRVRFAPSPTGLLHIGNARTALFNYLFARRHQGILVLRIEDTDLERSTEASFEEILKDLRWLGIPWDEGPDRVAPKGPYRQSERSAHYEAAIARLAADGLVYLCDCSRRDIANIASAPHAGEEGPRYPGTCRSNGMRLRAWKRPPAVRVALPDREVVVHDAFQGTLRQNVSQAVGDFVLRRGDGVFAYQLAVVVDDLAMGVTEIVRGFDLLGSSPRQVLLAEMLGRKPSGFAHVPLIVDSDGERLQKRKPRHTLRGQRAAGVGPDSVIWRLAHSLGLAPDKPAARSPVSLLGQALDLAKLQGLREIRLSQWLV